MRTRNLGDSDTRAQDGALPVEVRHVGQDEMTAVARGRRIPRGERVEGDVMESVLVKEER